MIIDAVATHALARAKQLALADLATGQRWSYAALDGVVDRVAVWLIDHLGPASGARVATLARNAAAMIILKLACIRAGAIFVPFNWRLAEAEIAALSRQAEPALVFHDADFAPPAAGSAYLLSDLDALTAGCIGKPDPAARRAFDAPGTLLFTSGTSGRPKGVIITEANAFWGCTNFMLGNNVTNNSVFLCDMPLFHTAGLFAAVHVPLLAGGAVLISQGFDPKVTLARIADPALAITHYFSVPQMARMMWDRPEFDPAMLRGLHGYAVGGAPNPPALIENFVRAGIKMSNGFGMSETGSNATMPVDDEALQIAKAGSCGLPFLSLQVRIVGDDGHDVPDGETGELWLAGPSVTPGYWNDAETTAKAFHEGWFKTGDAAMRDADGFLYIVDRRKDMYISGGENVYPAEVEAVVSELADVAEVAIIGVPDLRWGEVGCAFVVAAPGKTVTQDQVLTRCAARLAKFKVPARVVIASALPRTASGKVQKHLLRASSGKSTPPPHP
jgi:fatty-acyl-CoA synthase